MAVLRNTFFAILVVLSLAVLPASVRADEDDLYHIYTTHLPPWSMKGQTGTLFRVVEEIELRRGSYTHIESVPWIRAQSWAKTRRNVLIFPLTRTTAREKDYQWVAPLVPIELVFASKGQAPATLENAKKLFSIGALARTPSEQFLKVNGFKNIEASNSGTGSLVQWLQKGRIDAWFEARAIILHSLSQYQNFGPVSFSPAIFSADLYIAASPQMNPQVIADYRRILEDMHQDGSFDQLSRQ